YQRRRANAFLVAVNCTQACGTGFCASLGTGPRATSGFDLALTEVCEGAQHYFLVEVGTILGAQIMAEIPQKPAGAREIEAATPLVEKAARNLCRVLDTTGLKELLYRNYEHPRWEQVAARCLSCGNCTLVCPTCFCHTIEDTTDLTGTEAERRRRWDSCFTVDFSFLHGGSVRTSAASRYRQWLTHKLATWQDQFGCLGCVGCGRCLTWCPVAIDITEEVRAIRATETSPKE
ncbi:MAG: 4Fe-4S dicluster domain-containing protein, partial [Desulfobaccales bacterium]|nr:4Fe-4S dicluster domain-containing protein [Desulfobaccales bacterium]